MLRYLAVLCALGTAASAGPGKRAVHLVPEDDKSAHHLLAAEHADDFPAVSEDGSTIAQLFQEGEDFTGAPITTLVLWSNTGKRLASFRLGGYTDPSRPPELASKIAAYEWPIVAAANTQLSRHRWQPLPVAKTCGDAPDVESALCFPDGLVIHYDHDTGRLGIQHGKRQPLWVTVTFPPTGERSSAEGGGACGGMRGLAEGFGSVARGIVILAPAASLGGDSCIGQPTSETVVALPVAK